MSDGSKRDMASEMGLDRLLEDLVRDGWLMGMNAGVDAAMVRMDPDTGTCNRAYFLALAERAIGDSQIGQRRSEDGPSPGSVAVLSVRVLDWAGLGARIGDGARMELARRVARVLREVLRVDDVIGRTEEDTFSLLLRGCPEDLHDIIADRCRLALNRERVQVDGVVHHVRVAARTWTWSGESAEELVDACAVRLTDA
jgi:GGDEF domain-containing protein